jgi:hypothetical protein
MKALALLVAVVLALGASGYASKQQTISGARVGVGTTPKTCLIMVSL